MRDPVSTPLAGLLQLSAKYCALPLGGLGRGLSAGTAETLPPLDPLPNPPPARGRGQQPVSLPGRPRASTGVRSTKVHP